MIANAGRESDQHVIGVGGGASCIADVLPGDEPADVSVLASSRTAITPSQTRAHARFGDRIATAADLGDGDRFDRAIGSFAAAYADQNERDLAALQAAAAARCIVAEVGL